MGKDKDIEFLDELKERSAELYRWFTEKFNICASIRIDFDGVHIENEVAFCPNDYITGEKNWKSQTRAASASQNAKDFSANHSRK